MNLLKQIGDYFKSSNSDDKSIDTVVAPKSYKTNKMSTQQISDMINFLAPTTTSYTSTVVPHSNYVTIPNPNPNTVGIGHANYANLTAQANYTVGTGVLGSVYTTTQTAQSSSLVSLSNGGKELVRLERDGTVIWEEGVTIDEAAEAFSKMLRLSAELSAGISYGTKQRMRDAVFQEIVSMAEEKGSLSHEELTFLWQAAKIMDKLKGVK